MTAARPTKAAMAALQAELDAALEGQAQLQGHLEILTVDRDAWRAAHHTDAETEALAGCTRAIDALLTSEFERAEEQARQTSARGGYTTHTVVRAPLTGDGRSTVDHQVGRILLHLAARFGVPIQAVVPPPPEPEPPSCVGCGRTW